MFITTVEKFSNKKILRKFLFFVIQMNRLREIIEYFIVENDSLNKASFIETL